MAANKEGGAASNLNVPGEACRLPAGEGGQDQDTGGAHSEQRGAAEAQKRVLKQQGTRTPPKERGGGTAGGAAPTSPAASEEAAHDGDTEQGEDGRMDDDPEPVAEADDLDDSEDIVAYVKRVTAEANKKIDRIKTEHDGKVELLSRKIQTQLNKQADQISKLTAKVEEGKEHTERVRQQVIQESHRSDGRYAELNKQLEQVMDLVRGGREEAGAQGAAAGSAAPRPTARPQRGVGDPLILRVNAHETVERVRVLEAVQSFATAHTEVLPDVICIAGPATGRHFVVKVQGDVQTATRRVDELFEALRDQTGQWRTLDAQTTEGATTRLHMGRDKPREQMQGEVFGKRLVAVLRQRFPKAEVYNSRRDGVVHVDRQPVVKVDGVAEGPPQLSWNYPAIERIGVTKQEIMNDLERSGAAAGAQVNWEP